MRSFREIKDLFTIDEDSFETYLDYEYYEDDLFWMKSRCFFGIEIIGGISYYSPAADLLSYYDRLTSVLRSLPADSEASLQSLFLPYRDIIFDPPAAKSDNDFVKSAYDSVVLHIKRAAKDGYFNQYSILRDVRNLLFVIFPTTFSDKMSGGLKVDDKKVRYKSWMQAFLKALDTHGVQYRLLNANDFLYAMFTLLNQDFDPLQIEYHASETLSRQLMYNVLRTDNHEIAYQKKRWVMGYLSQLTQVKPGLLVELMTLQRPFFVSAILHKVTTGALMTRLMARRQSVLSKERRLQYDQVVEEVAATNNYKVEAYFGFLVENIAEVDVVRAELSSFTGQYKWTILFEDQVAPDLLRSSLPGHFNKKIQRELYLFEDHALCFLSFRNFRKHFSDSGTILVGEDLSPKIVSVFDSTAFGTMVSGGSGSGKTFFSQYNIIMSLAEGQHIFVIDPLGNFKSLCDLIGGAYYKIGVASDCDGIDIFPQLSAEKLFAEKNLVMIICEFVIKLLQFGMASYESTPKLISIIENTLITMYKKTPYRDIETFVQILESEASTRSDVSGLASMYDDLQSSLLSFLPERAYGNLLSKTRLDLSNRFTVFDVSSVYTTPKLLQLSIFGLMSKISPFVMEDSSTRKVLMIDEAHSLIKDAESAAFLGSGVRVWRTFNGSLCLITQQLTDLLENKEVGEGIFKTLESFFLLSQSPESFRAAQAFIGYTSAEMKALNGLRTLQGRYSQLAYYTKSHRSDGQSAFGRFYLAIPKFLYWAFTTDPNEKALRQKRIAYYLKEGYTSEQATTKAIEDLVNKVVTLEVAPTKVVVEEEQLNEKMWEPVNFDDVSH